MALTDAEREPLYAALTAHAAAETITLDELERRIERIAASGTRAQAAAVLADLPDLPAATPAPPQAGRPRWGHGHGDADAPDPGWQATRERFRDPRTGQVMRVWEDGGGGRHYVPDDGS